MTDFKKNDAGKPDLALWPPRAFVAVGRVLTHGAAEYGAANWRKVDEPRRYLSAALRHIFAVLGGEPRDSESGEHHFAHAICSLAFLLELEEEATEAALESQQSVHELAARMRAVVPLPDPLSDAGPVAALQNSTRTQVECAGAATTHRFGRKSAEASGPRCGCGAPMVAPGQACSGCGFEVCLACRRCGDIDDDGPTCGCLL